MKSSFSMLLYCALSQAMMLLKQSINSVGCALASLAVLAGQALLAMIEVFPNCNFQATLACP